MVATAKKERRVHTRESERSPADQRCFVLSEEQ
jgi:hypothetical protein